MKVFALMIAVAADLCLISVLLGGPIFGAEIRALRYKTCLCGSRRAI